MIIVVDYGMGNLGSVERMLKKCGAKFKISNNAKDILLAEKIILPGVGSFDKGMQNLHDLNLVEVIIQKATADKTPILGICLGMQLLTNGSEEGRLPGLGLVDAFSSKFSFESQSKLKVPHMGWNIVYPAKENTLYEGMGDEIRFYFVHSYAVMCKIETDILTKTNYGYSFVSSFQSDNIVGAQFHPEKSHKFGIQFFKNFLDL